MGTAPGFSQFRVSKSWMRVSKKIVRGGMRSGLGIPAVTVRRPGLLGPIFGQFEIPLLTLAEAVVLLPLV